MRRGPAASVALALVLLGVLGPPRPARAGGWSIGLPVPTLLARAGAFVARADHPAAIRLNPAGLTRLGRHHLYLGLSASQQNASISRKGIDDLVEQKRSGSEKETLAGADLDLHAREYARLVGELERARDESRLPTETQGRDELHDFLVELRLRRVDARR